MKFTTLLERAVQALVALTPGARAGDARKLGALDAGVLQVALMVSALDGEVLPAEMEAYARLLRTCRGFVPGSEKAALETACRRAGYLVMLAQSGLHTPEDRVAAFVDEAIAALPGGLLDGSIADLRRAFVMWMTMALADGDYSGIERAGLEALRDRFAQLDLTRQDEAALAWASAYADRAYFPGAAALGPQPAARTKLLEDDFLARAQERVSALAAAETDAARRAAEQALAAFIDFKQEAYA